MDLPAKVGPTSPIYGVTRATVGRVTGWQAACSCEWRSRARPRKSQAVDELIVHLEDVHGLE